MKITKKARLTFTLSAVFYILQAIISVVLAFMLQNIVDSASVGNMESFVFFLIVTFMIWPLDIVFVLLAAKFKVDNIKEMLKVVKKYRLNFLFLSKTPLKDETKELSFFTADIDVLNNSYYNIRLSLFHYLPLFLFSLISLLFINWVLTIVLSVVSLLPMLTTWIFGKSLALRKKLYSDKAAFYVENIKEIIDGKRDILAFDKQEIFNDRHDTANESMENARAKSKFLGEVSSSLGFNIGFLVQITGVGLGSYFVITGELTFGFLIATMQLVNNLIWPVVHGAEIFNTIKSSKFIREKAFERHKKPDYKPILIDGFEDSIDIINLSVKYDDGEYIFKNLNLKFKKGKKYVLQAPSGFGKSSIAKVIALENDNYEGQINIDGKNLRQIDSKSLHNILRFVRQDPYIFSDTIKNNILFFSHSNQENKLKSTLEIFESYNFFKNNNDFFNRNISNSSGLSGGQKQCLVLARALLHDPQILILDEITSNLDIETSYKILQSLFKNKYLTCIVITHENDEKILSLFDEKIILNSTNIVKQLQTSNTCIFK